MFRFLRSFSKDHQKQMQLLYSQGKSHLEKKEWQAAFDKFDQIVKEEPHQKGALHNRARAQVELDKINTTERALPKPVK